MSTPERDDLTLPEDDEAGLGGLSGERTTFEKPKDQPTGTRLLDEAKHRANVRFWSTQDRHPDDRRILAGFDADPVFKPGEKVRIEQGGEAEWEVRRTDYAGIVSVGRVAGRGIDQLELLTAVIKEDKLAALNPEK